MVQFRQAGSEDAIKLVRIKQLAIDSITTEAYEREQLEAWKPDADGIDDFRAAIEGVRHEVPLAERDGRAVAYGVLDIDTGHVDGLFVSPDHAREGIGSSLLRQIESSAKIQGFSTLSLDASLNSRSFYSSHGYHGTHRVTRHMSEAELDFLIMEKDI